MRVRNHINARFKDFIHNKVLLLGDCDCTYRRRVDHRCLIDETILAVETDEFRHRSYDARDEEIRYDDLYSVYAGKWIFIRFNPDGPSKVKMEDRLEVLGNEIEKQINRIKAGANVELLEIFKLFYD